MTAPSDIEQSMKKKNIIREDSEILFHESQRRVSNLLFPSHVILTERQIIKYSPSLIGHETETRTVDRINDIDVRTGLLTDTVGIESRELDDFVVSGIPKNTGNRLRNEIHRLKGK
jgi:hypothetical protein